MDIEEGIELINHIYEKKREDKAYQLYSSLYPNMTKETYITFEEFYKPQKQDEVVEAKTADEILNNVKELMSSHSWR